jgi:hypothetical protein
VGCDPRSAQGRRPSGRALAPRLARVVTQPKSQVAYLTSRIVVRTTMARAIRC